MNTFKLSQKQVHKDSRSSIEHIHDEYIYKVQEKYDQYESKYCELNNLKNKLSKIEDKKDMNAIFKLKDRIKELEEELYDIENQTELTDYLCKAIPFMKETEETINKVSDSNTGILKYVKSNGITEKGTKYVEYLETCFNIPPELNRYKNTECSICKSIEKIIDAKEATIICVQCGLCETYTDNNSVLDWSRADSTEFLQVFTYKRKNHFKEWLTQLQASECTVISDDILDLIYLELKKERVTDTDQITHDRIRKYLKKLRLNKYYEHIPNIIRRITKKPGLQIDDELEKKLMLMFDIIQEPFKKHCPSNRKNFLSYSFTLYKFCQILNRNDLLIYFPLLKSREKLFEQEKIWKNICEDLNWKYIPTI